VIAVILLLVLGIFNTSSSSGPSGALVIDGENGRIIQGLQIRSTDGPCLVIRNSRNITVRDSEIGPCGGNGIEIFSSSSVKVVDSYVHPEFVVKSCCDTGDGVLAVLSSNVLVQGNVIAYGESNVLLLGVKDTSVVGNFLLNPLGPFPRGTHAQVWGYGSARSSNVTFEANYALSSQDAKFKFPDGQADGFNAGYTDGVVMRDNYLRGGRHPYGCSYLIDNSANNVQVLNNTALDFGNCGIGLGSGTHQIVDGNRLYSSGLDQPFGNTALYVWQQYSAPCGPVQISNNVAVLIRPDGSLSSWWKGSGCDPTTMTGNTFGRPAIEMLTPVDSKNPAPSIPPRSYARRPVSPFSPSE